jgi:hypothetical protein
VNLLTDAGLKASPVLVSTKENGRLKTTDPGFEQFNTVMAYGSVDSNFYVLDATDKITPPNIIPPSVVYTDGLVISKLDLNKSVTDQDWVGEISGTRSRSIRNSSTLPQNLTARQNLGDVFLMHRDYARSR